MFQWKQIRYRLEWVGVKLLTAFIPRLSRRACVRLSQAVGSVAYAVDGAGRRVALANIEAAFGSQYTPAQRRRIARQSYQYFARTMLDLFWAPRLNTPAGARYAEVIGAEAFEALRREHPVVVMVAHFAGFEWVGLAGSLHGFRGFTLSQAFKNPLLDSLFTALRTCTGQQLITQEISMLRMLRQVMKGNTVGMLIDLNLPPTQSATVIDTFGMKMCATHLHAVLASRAGARLVPVTSHPRPDGSCRIEFHPPIQFPPGSSTRQIAQIAWNFFEQIIRRDPGMWMWQYKHWRFRPRGDSHPYPFYASDSGKFAKLLKSIDD